MNNGNVNKDSVLGIDIGSVSISLALLNEQKEIIKTDYTFHEGLIASKLTSMFSQFNLQNIKDIAVTSSAPSIFPEQAFKRNARPTKEGSKSAR